MREILLQYKSTSGVSSCNKQSIYPGVSVSQRPKSYSCTFIFTYVGLYVLVCSCLERRHCFNKLAMGFHEISDLQPHFFAMKTPLYLAIEEVSHGANCKVYVPSSKAKIPHSLYLQNNQTK